MSRSLFSAVSGLANDQEWLDVIGNNIANANTPGFKASSVVFQDILSQTLSAGSAPGTNCPLRGPLYFPKHSPARAPLYYRNAGGSRGPALAVATVKGS